MSFDIKKFSEGVHSYLSQAFGPINARHRELAAEVAALKASVAALEAHTKGFTYLGTWRDGPTYVRGNSVTDHGSLFICRAERTQQRPGDGSDWSLACKRGKDGRDAT